MVHLVLIMLASAAVASGADGRAPVVLVPGLAGSVIEVKLDGAAAPHFWCKSKSDWFVQWLALDELVPLQKDCTLSRLALTYNETTGRLSNAPHVLIDSNVDFGGVNGVKYLDPAVKSVLPYYATMIDNLTSTLGYVVGKDLHGAGFDWRLGPIGHSQADAPGGYFAKLAALIESTVANNSAKAHVVTHSLGGPTFQAFMLAQGSAWCAKYVASFIPFSAPWAGAAPMVLTEVGGDNLGYPIPHDYLASVQQQAESGAFLLPYDSRVWGNGTMVTTPSQQYTVDQLPQMLLDLGLNQTHALYAAMSRRRLLAGQLPPPPTVPTHVMYTTGVDTKATFRYKHAFVPSGTDEAPEETTMSDGDGTVNLPSLQYAERFWGSRGGATTTFYSVAGVEHGDSIKDARMLARLLEILTADGAARRAPLVEAAEPEDLLHARAHASW